LGTFQLSVRPFSQGSPLPLKSVAAVPAGSRLIWNPAHLRLPPSNSAQVTVVVVPANDGVLLTLEPRKASERTEWQLLQRPLVIALVYGPQGLSEGKLQALVTRNQDLLRELADYAEQSSQVESLVQELADAEESRVGADTALKGLSAEYGVSATKLSAATGSDQQAAVLLNALVPASTTYDPLAVQSAQVQQTGGLAGAVAGLFFGNPVTLAAGGAALFMNLKTVLFPNTEFRSAFAQNAEKGNLALCTKTNAAKLKTRAAYLWAYRVPQMGKPALALTRSPNLVLGTKSAVELKPGKEIAKEVALARDWRLVSAGGAGAFSVPVAVTPTGTLEVDLSKAKVPAGDYQLGFMWDWEQASVQGTVHVHPADDLSNIALTPKQHDKLIEGSGIVTVELSGPDFEFMEKATLLSSARGAKPVDAEFNLPVGKRAGPQNVVAFDIDTAKQGTYTLSLAQADGVPHKVPLTVLPPNPKISNLPLRFNSGEAKQAIHLKGSGMDRIEAVTSDAGEITGAAAASTGAAATSTGAAATSTGAAATSTGAAATSSGATATSSGATAASTGAAATSSGAAATSSGAAAASSGATATSSGATATSSGAAATSSGAAATSTGAAATSTGAAATSSGAVDSDDWTGEIHLKPGLKRGQTFALALKVKGLDDPLTLPEAVEIVGGRPKILSMQKSLPGTLGIEIGADELPAGLPAGLVLHLGRVQDSARPRVDLSCETGELRHALTLSAGTPVAGASLTTAGPGALYLSVDPGSVGYPGCELSATVVVEPDGRSDPYILGRVVRVPRLDRFTLTSEKAGDASYIGSVDGHDLDVIEKVGWDPANGVPVDAIPTPIPGEHPSQNLRVALPWPAPAPHAPLYIWLRGESQGRKTSVAY